MMRKNVCLLAVALACAVAVEAVADDILVGAPVFNNFSSWVSQSGFPPSGPVFNLADQFSLTRRKTSRRFTFRCMAQVPSPLAIRVAPVDSLTSATPIQSTFSTLQAPTRSPTSHCRSTPNWRREPIISALPQTGSSAGALPTLRSSSRRMEPSLMAYGSSLIRPVSGAPKAPVEVRPCPFRIQAFLPS